LSSYVPTNWQDYPSLATAINAARLNNMESGISAAEQAAHKGAANGYAALDATGKIPSAQLPAVGSTNLVYHGDYVAGTYNDGDIVVYNGILYMCTQSGVTAIPGAWPPPGAQDAIPTSLVDNAGDLLVGTANDTVAKLPAGSVGQVLTRISAAPLVGWQNVAASGAELDYAQITANSAAISAATEATAVTVITGNSVTYDGTKIKVEFFCPGTTNTSGQTGTFVVLRDAVVIGRANMDIGLGNAAIGDRPTYIATFDTPASGAHVYKLAAFTSAGTFTVRAGAGGPGNFVPSYLRVTKA
jgi:hypothetical protein